MPYCYEAEKLKAYDREHGTEYVRTLHTYLLYERNAVLAAEALYTHRNTVRNRIEKIFSLIGHRLDDPIVRLRVFASVNKFSLQ